MDLLEPASPALAVPPDEIAALDATLTVADWPLVQRLWKLGFSNASVYHLLRLRARYRRYGPETDGLATDPRALFARWLVSAGRLHEGA